MQKRRLEREQEKAAMEEELAMIQRQRAHAEAVELEAKEEVVRLWTWMGHRLSTPMPSHRIVPISYAAD